MILSLVSGDLAPIEADVAADFHAPLIRVLHRVQHFGRRQERFRRDAAVVEARAAEMMFLDDGHARTELRRLECRHVAARAGTDHQKLIVLRHVRPARRPDVQGSPAAAA